MRENQGSEKKSVRFSVLVPVYNAQKYLDECIESVIRQTFQDYELILVNDGSSDQSGEICDEYAKKYAFIKAYHKANGGQLHARKYAVDHACGEFCVFLDSDDLLSENALERMDSAIRETSCDLLIYVLGTVVDGKPVSCVYDKEDCVIEDKRSLYKKVFLSLEYNSMCRKAVRTAFLQGTEYPEYYYSIRYGEDLLQSLDVFRKSKRVSFIRDSLYYYRANPASVTHNIKNEIFTNNEVREIVLSFLKEEKVFTPEDFEEYRLFCLELFLKKIFSIARLEIEEKEKKEFIDRLKKDPYYKEFICTKSYGKINAKFRVFYFLFEKGAYHSLIRLVMFTDKLKKTVKQIRVR
jgi:glycosyltransferase involved in cell wall biosynthesis